MRPGWFCDAERDFARHDPVRVVFAAVLAEIERALAAHAAFADWLDTHKRLAMPAISTPKGR